LAEAGVLHAAVGEQVSSIGFCPNSVATSVPAKKE